MAIYSADPKGELIHHEIVPRDLTFYLAMEADLSNVASSSKLADLLSLIASLLWGAFASVFLAIRSSVGIPDEMLALLKTYRGFFCGFAIVFTVLAIYFVLRTRGAIKLIKTSSWTPGKQE